MTNKQREAHEKLIAGVRALIIDANAREQPLTRVSKAILTLIAERLSDVTDEMVDDGLTAGVKRAFLRARFAAMLRASALFPGDQA